MADLTKIIDIKINLGTGKVTIDGLTSSMKNLDKASRDLSKTMIGKVQPAYKRTEQAILDQIALSKQHRANTAQTTIEYDRQTQGIKRLEEELARLRGETGRVTKSMGGMVDKTGLAGAAVVEIGRTISDSNYGFQGMANNLSQLATLMTTLIATTGGVKQGFQALLAAFRGPLGVIVVFQIVIAMFERMSLAADKNKESLDDFTKSIEDQQKSLKSLTVEVNSYLRKINDQNIAEDKRAILIQEVAEKSGDLNEIVKQSKGDLDKLNSSIQTYIEQQTIRLQLDLLLVQSAEEQNKLEEVRRLQRTGDAKAMREALIEEGEMTKNLLDLIGMGSLSESEFLIKNQFKLFVQSLEGQASVTEKEVNRLISLLEEGLKKTKKSGDRALKDYKTKLFDVQRIEEQFRQESLKGELLTDEERIEQKRDFSVQEIRLAYEVYIEKEKLRLKEYLASNATEQQKAQAVKRSLEAQAQAFRSLGDVIVQINNVAEADTTLLVRSRGEMLRADLEKTQAAVLATDALILAEKINTLSAWNRSAIDAIDLENEANQAAHKERLRLLNIEKDERIANNLSTDAVDKKIDLERQKRKTEETEYFRKSEQAKLAIANQVGEAIIAIAGEGSAVGKAVAVAMATMNTYEAVTAALGAKPYGPWNIAQAAAVAAMGFVQVRNILKTEVPSPKGGASGGAAAGVTINPPDFNIVGQSASNQLASAVQGQFNQPVKAYVVSKDVSTAQEMDRNIVATASLG